MANKQPNHNHEDKYFKFNKDKKHKELFKINFLEVFYQILERKSNEKLKEDCDLLK